MSSGSRRPLALLTKVVAFDDPAIFLREYESNIRFGGMFLPWENPPCSDTEVRLELHFPFNLSPVCLEARVVHSSPHGVGIQISTLNAGVRTVLEGYLSICRLAVNAKAAGQGLPAPAPQKASPFQQETRSTATLLGASSCTIEIEDDEDEDDALELSLADTPLPAHRPYAQEDDDPLPPPETLTVALGADPDEDDPDLEDEDDDDWMMTLDRLVGDIFDDDDEEGLPDPVPSSLAAVPLFPPTPPRASPPASAPASYALPTAAPGLEPAIDADPVPGALETQPQGPSVQTSPAPRPSPAPGQAQATQEGDLASLSMLQLLTGLSRRKANGILVVNQLDRESHLLFREGSVCRARLQPPAPHLYLGELLVGINKITRQERDGALEEARREGIRLGQALIRRKSIQSKDLQQALTRQMHGMVLEQFAGTQGRFQFYDQATPPKEVGLRSARPVALYFRSLVDRFKLRLQSELEAVEGHLTFQYVFRANPLPLDLDQLGLDEDERRFWHQVVTGGFQLQEVYAASPLSRRHSHGLLFALQSLAMVEFKPEVDPTIQHARVKDILDHKLAAMGGQSPFGVLEVHWMALETELETAYYDRRKAYDFTQLPGLPAELVQKSRDILKALDDARDAVRSHDQRKKLRTAFLEANQLIFHIDLLVQQGEMAIYQNNYRDARDRFLHVLELAPGHKVALQKLASFQGKAISSSAATPA